MVGNFPGALAQINVMLSVFFAGISGSSTADAASQSKIFIDAQVKEGYDLSFSIAITAVSAVLAVIIPPSILMIVWGGVLTVDRRDVPGRNHPGPADRLRADGDGARLREDAQLSGLPARDAEGILHALWIATPGAVHAVHHRRRQGLRVVHRHRVGGDRGDLRGDPVDIHLPRDGPEELCTKRCSKPAGCPR